MNLSEEIKRLAGREVEFTKTSIEGEDVFVPIYISYNLKSKISEIASPSLEEAQTKFIQFLEGDTDVGIHPEPESDGEDPKEDSGAS